MRCLKKSNYPPIADNLSKEFSIGMSLSVAYSEDDTGDCRHFLITDMNDGTQYEVSVDEKPKWSDIMSIVKEWIKYEFNKSRGISPHP